MSETASCKAALWVYLWVTEFKSWKGAVKSHNVRTLCHHLAAGRDQGAVRLWRTAEFSAALQRGADPADSDRAARRRQAHVRAHALGLHSGLGGRPQDFVTADQRARRIGARQAGVPQCHAAAALPPSGRWLL